MLMAASRSEWTNWIEEAKAADSLILTHSLNVPLKHVSADEWAGPCPVCGGRDRFSVNARKRIFNCRGCGAKGDNIALVMHITGSSFNDACERITGRPRPDDTRDETFEERQARIRANERRAAEMQARREAQEREEAAKARRDEQAVADVLERAEPLEEGGYGWRYLKEARGLTPKPELVIDLRFVRELDYWGLRDDASDKPALLAVLPALIALIRDVYGAVIGFSATYLDPKEPKKWAPNGSAYNSPKKIRGDKRGGMIRLGRLKECVAIAEGWENALAWYQLGHGPEDVSLAAAVDLGNLSGKAAGGVDHQWIKERGKPRRIQNGMPDPDHPGVVLPKGITSAILLGDSDSEFSATVAHMITAVHRFLDHGVETSVHWAPAGLDWNKALIAHLKANGG